MAFGYQDVLAGPVLRRVDRRLAAVWLALRKPADVTLKLWEGLKDGDVADAPLATATVASRRLGAELHLALVVATRPDEAEQQLKSGVLYSYDITLQEKGASGQGLLALGLLGEPDSAGKKAALPLGYKNRRLPSFALPPSQLDKLVLLQGSCRLPYSPIEDAMPSIDELLLQTDAQGKPAYEDPLRRPHQLFLTGDQIYADELSPYQLELANQVGDRLLRGAGNNTPGELLPVEHAGQTYFIPATCGFFPPARRQRLTRYIGFSSSAGGSHALSFGEYAALYLLAWSEALWPADFFENALAAQRSGAGKYTFRTEELFQQVDDHDFGGDTGRELAEIKQDYFHGWNFLKKEWRALDLELTAADRREEWGAEEALNGFLLADPPDTATDAPTRLTLPADTPAAVKRTLAKRLTPSWFAGVREMGFEAVIKETVSYDFYNDKALVQLRALQNYHAGLPKVRRLLANIPTYMTFDDHEVTDDWNVTQNWIQQVNGNPLGVTVLRNALLSFGLFQAWGNDPLYFQGTEDTPGKRLLQQAEKLFPPAADAAGASGRQAALDALNRLFNLGGADTPVADRVRWRYQVGGPGYEVISLDTRTQRGFKTTDGPPELLTLEALQQQIPADPVYSYGAPPQGQQGITFVIAAAPVLGFPPVEYLVQPMTNTADRLSSPPAGVFARAELDYFTGAVEHDPEPWSYHEDIVEALFARLLKHKRVVFLSGDVHYACSVKLDYWRFKDNTQPAAVRFLQLTASGFKSYPGKANFALFRQGVVSRLASLLTLPRERLAWQDIGARGAPLAPPAGGKFSNLIRRRLREDPVLIPVAGLPPGSRQNYAPAWAWRLDLLKDARPDADRFPGLTPPQFRTEPGSEPGKFAAHIGARHFWQTVHGPSGVVSFASNVGRITFDVAPNVKLNFALHSLLHELPEAGFKPFLAYAIALDPVGETPPAVPAAN